jgi:hypothetical protein
MLNEFASWSMFLAATTTTTRALPSVQEDDMRWGELAIAPFTRRSFHASINIQMNVHQDEDATKGSCM